MSTRLSRVDLRRRSALGETPSQMAGALGAPLADVRAMLRELGLPVGQGRWAGNRVHTVTTLVSRLRRKRDASLSLEALGRAVDAVTRHDEPEEQLLMEIAIGRLQRCPGLTEEEKREALKRLRRGEPGAGDITPDKLREAQRRLRAGGKLKDVAEELEINESGLSQALKRAGTPVKSLRARTMKD